MDAALKSWLEPSSLLAAAAPRSPAPSSLAELGTALALPVAVVVTDGDGVPLTVAVTDGDSVPLTVAVTDGDGVPLVVAVTDGDSVPLTVAVTDGDGVPLAVIVTDGVTVGVGLVDGLGALPKTKGPSAKLINWEEPESPAA